MPSVINNTLEREEFLRQLFEKAPIGLNLCTMEGLWIQSNPAFLSIIGYTAEEADGGLTYWGRTPPEYSGQEAEQLKMLNETHRYGPYEKEFIRKDGSRIPVLLNGFITERNGKKYIWSFIEDLSQKKEAEKEKEEALQQLVLNSRLASLGTLAAGVAHEINNPLAIMYLHLEKIKNNRSALPEQVQESFEVLSGCAERITRIVKDLGNYARPEPHSSLGLQKFDVHEAISQALSLSSEIYRADGIQISLDLGAQNTLVAGESFRFQQVITNLISNARDAMAESNMKRLGISTQDEGSDLVLTVKDTGPGISSEVLSRIFDAFFTTKGAGHGMGLGLGICRRLVGEMGGTLSAYSEPGAGARFVVRLPSHSGQSVAVPEKIQTKSMGKNMGRVLFVEDEEELREIISVFLQDQGLCVDCASNGEEALRALEANTYDLIFTDLKMPGYSGLDLLERYCESFPSTKTGFLLITGNLDANTKRRWESLPGRTLGIIEKPDILGQLRKIWPQLQLQIQF